MAQVGVSIVSENCSDNSEWVGLTILLKKRDWKWGWDAVGACYLRKAEKGITYHIVS